MINLVKYELLGKYKSYGMVLILALLLNIALLFTVGSWPDGAIFALSILIMVGVFVAVLVLSIGVFSQDIYEDRGYLTFTLPQSGYSILASKLLVTLIFYFLSMTIAAAFLGHFFFSINDIKVGLDAVGIKINMPLILAAIIVTEAMSFVMLLTMIYFSIAVTKLAIAKKRSGKFAAFVVFVLISIVYKIIIFYLAKFIPQNVYIPLVQAVSGNISANIDPTGELTRGIPVNIASTVFAFITFIGMFIGTALIVEKKIDL